MAKPLPLQRGFTKLDFACPVERVQRRAAGPALIPDHMLKFHISAAQRKDYKAKRVRLADDVVGVSGKSNYA
jgi:hypothetical protein